MQIWLQILLPSLSFSPPCMQSVSSGLSGAAIGHCGCHPPARLPGEPACDSSEKKSFRRRVYPCPVLFCAEILRPYSQSHQSHEASCWEIPVGHGQSLQSKHGGPPSIVGAKEGGCAGSVGSRRNRVAEAWQAQAVLEKKHGDAFRDQENLQNYEMPSLAVQSGT